MTSPCALETINAEAPSRDLSFASHVQAFANLLNTSLNAPDDHKARVALDMYSVFQSAPKIRRRLNRSPRLRELAVLQPRFHVALTPSSMDKIRIRAVLLTNNGVKLHPSLYGFLRDPTTDPHRWLPEFHRFFKWFLAIVDGEIKQLQELRSGELAPLALPETVVDHAFNNLAVMRYFSWESVFFASYIRAAFEAEVESTEEIPSPEQMAVRQMEEEEEDAGFDISTEFETGEDQASAAVTQPAIHPCILELRLITSNIQHLNTLLQRSPKSSFRFQVIQYARSDDTLKPWQELISELFPSKDLESDVLQALRNAPGKKFNTFRPGGPVLKFKGQAHCEAVLGCLYSLSKRSEDITWVTTPPCPSFPSLSRLTTSQTGIPKSLLNAISTCYSLLAPSKRCCPVCANTISLLSIEAADAGGPYIHALSKHSITFPCAFPIGLPRSVRGKLLELYRRELRERLTDLLALERKLSGRSTQSATLSLDGDAEAAAAERENWALLRMYQSGWAELQPEERRERWAEATADLEMEQLVAWWAEMEMETKLGLVPPATGGS